MRGKEKIYRGRQLNICGNFNKRESKKKYTMFNLYKL